MPKTTKKTTAREGKKMEQVCALWKHKAKSGTKYFTGKTNDVDVVAFYNTDKKNPKEPDLRIYAQIKEEGKTKRGEEICSLWVSVSEKTQKKYLSGKLNDQRVVGFIYEGENEKAPYISVYLSEEMKSDPQEHIEVEEDDTPF